MTKNESVDAASLHPIVPRPLADEVADKARSVFELMQRMSGSKAFGSIVGTDILITIERLNEESERPGWWPDDWEWPGWRRKFGETNGTDTDRPRVGP